MRLLCVGRDQREGIGQGEKPLEELIEGKTVLREVFGQGFPRDVFHDDEQDVIRVFQREDLGYIGMVEFSGGLGFGAKSGQAFRVVSEGFREHLDGDLALQTGVFGEIHFTHAALAEFPEDMVVQQRLTDHRITPSSQCAVNRG